jgi:hypothetical protein
MVSLKLLLLTVASTVTVLAQDPPPTGDPVEAAAYWEAATNGQTSAGTPDEKRDFIKVPRNDPAVMKDPYKGSYCWAPYTTPPCATTCNRNNCFRAFLNARDGSDGKHCPKEAFGFCCAWNNAPIFIKYWGIESGAVEYFAPYTKNCKSSGDYTWDVLNKLNDACGCTLNHEVKVDVTSDYYKLRYYDPHSPQCK